MTASLDLPLLAGQVATTAPAEAEEPAAIATVMDSEIEVVSRQLEPVEQGQEIQPKIRSEIAEIPIIPEEFRPLVIGE